MRKSAMFGMIAAAGLTLGACATDRYGDRYGHRDNNQLERAAAGAAIGAAAGAAVGATTSVEIEEGAAAGAVIGGVVGAATANNRRWYRDNRGYCFYVDDGRRIYDYDRRDC